MIFPSHKILYFSKYLFLMWVQCVFQVVEYICPPLGKGTIRNAGAGVYSIDFTLSYAIGRHFGNFDGEIAAISLALDKIEQCEKENNHLFC
ncbi:hypothetical protein CEXT_527531 [Caerostris extrusa]|uniref:Uncharacterized protein n=1 Tax=Caerostris extrusa TaxID=172846 RepID=A0AAV4RY40_CAEEX|nr:hypothetical protein CEXT_527531 [Caerostris extrusa]